MREAQRQRETGEIKVRERNKGGMGWASVDHLCQPLCLRFSGHVTVS